MGKTRINEERTAPIKVANFIRIMYSVIRTHVIPVQSGAECIVTSIYNKSIRIGGAIVTSFNMDRFIRKRWRRYDVWSSCEFEIQVGTYAKYLQAANSESIDQFWLDIKPTGDNFIVFGDMSTKETTCEICKETDRHQIQLSSCKCTFHQQCIETWTKYSSVCPICFSTIYKYSRLDNKCSAMENENELIVSDPI